MVCIVSKTIQTGKISVALIGQLGIASSIYLMSLIDYPPAINEHTQYIISVATKEAGFEITKERLNSTSNFVQY
jgi:hypothetical protein